MPEPRSWTTSSFSAMCQTKSSLGRHSTNGPGPLANQTQIASAGCCPNTGPRNTSDGEFPGHRARADRCCPCIYTLSPLRQSSSPCCPIRLRKANSTSTPSSRVRGKPKKCAISFNRDAIEKFLENIFTRTIGALRTNSAKPMSEPRQDPRAKILVERHGPKSGAGFSPRITGWCLSKKSPGRADLAPREQSHHALSSSRANDPHIGAESLLARSIAIGY